MIRKAFRMSLHAGAREEYIRRHNPIWPEMQAILREAGVHRYSICLDPASNQLFASLEVESEEKWNQLSQNPICRRWWDSMYRLMPSNPDHSPVSADLIEVFHLD